MIVFHKKSDLRPSEVSIWPPVPTNTTTIVTHRPKSSSPPEEKKSTYQNFGLLSGSNFLVQAPSRRQL